MSKHKRIRIMLESLRELASELDNSREKALLMTKLQEAGHWLEEDRKIRGAG